MKLCEYVVFQLNNLFQFSVIAFSGSDFIDSADKIKSN